VIVMAKPDAPRDDAPQPDATQPDAPRDDAQNDPQDDTTFAGTADDTTQLEQTMHTEPTERLETAERLETTKQLETTGQPEATEQLDTTAGTRAIGVAEQPSSTDLFGNPVHHDDDRVAAAASGSADREWPPALPERPSGPHAPAIVLGLVCLVVAGIIFAQELGGLSVDWGDIGPVGIILTGAVLVLFGLVGLLTSRRNSKTS
jgi:hypothetical protein